MCQIFLNWSKTHKVIVMTERCTGNLITLLLCQIKKWGWSFTKLNETTTHCYKIQGGIFSKSCVSYFGFHCEYIGSKCELNVGGKRIWGDLGTTALSSVSCPIFSLKRRHIITWECRINHYHRQRGPERKRYKKALTSPKHWQILDTSGVKQC